MYIWLQSDVALNELLKFSSAELAKLLQEIAEDVVKGILEQFIKLKQIIPIKKVDIGRWSVYYNF